MKKGSRQVVGIAIFFLLAILLLIQVQRDVVSGSETVEIVRDFWGIPHIFATSSEGAFYGLGYATAQDRMFQMEYSRRIVEGRISEIIGEKGLQSDKLWRTIGWYKNAQQIAENLDSQTKQFLQAYSAGVNRYLQVNSNLFYLFGTYGIAIEPWTVADSIACWYRISYFFGGLDQGEVGNLYDFEELVGQVGFEEATKQLFTSPIVDETGAIVQEQDVDFDLIVEIEEYLASYGYDNTFSPLVSEVGETPKASHAWVIGGNRTTTGTAILHSDPQLLVNSPSIWYEFHISGGEFDARGIGLAGAPGMLIGWNQEVAWGATAAKGDVADLYRLEINPQNANEYFYDGVYKAMDVSNEEITVRDGPKIPIKYRNTVLGPVVTSLLSNSGRDEFVMQHAEVYNTSLCSLKSAIEIMKANDYESFRSAIENYISPSIHMIYGDKDGNIAYQLLSGIPLRSSAYPFFGRVAQPGNSSDYAWIEIIPKQYLPHSFNPESGAISTANNMAAGTWYPLPMSFGTGDTMRSWRLRELLSMKSVFSPEDVLAIHQDTINPAVREVVRLARHITGDLNQTLSSQAMRALNALESWNGQYIASQQVYPLISNFNLMFRESNTPLALIYGGGEGGLSSFAKKINHDLNVNASYIPTEDEKDYVSGLLEEAWTKTVRDFGSDPSEWLDIYDRSINVKFQNNLENFGSLDPSTDFTSPPLMCKHTATILSQHGNSYSQNVRFDNVDLSRSVLPPGISEHPNSVFFDNQVSLWAEGELHIAPLSRKIIETNTTSTISLFYPPTPTHTPTESPVSTSTGTPRPTPTEPTVPTLTGTPLPSPTSSLPPTTGPDSYIIVGVVLTIATIAFAAVLLLLRKK